MAREIAADQIPRPDTSVDQTSLFTISNSQRLELQTRPRRPAVNTGGRLSAVRVITQPPAAAGRPVTARPVQSHKQLPHPSAHCRTFSVPSNPNY